MGPQGTLAQAAYQEIRRRILNGECPPGAALSRRKIANELGMSLLPVAEALQRLETDGLVESRPRVGTRVRVGNREEIYERYQLREALESQTARLFAINARASERTEILKMASHLDKLYDRCRQEKVDADFLHAVRKHHLRLHVRIAEIGGCNLLRETLEREQDLLFSWLSDTATQEKPLPKHFHQELAKGLCSGDPLIADAAIRSHISYALGQIREVIRPRTGTRWRLQPRKTG